MPSLNFRFNIWLKAPTRRATRSRTRRLICHWPILRRNMRIMAALLIATNSIFFTNSRMDPSNQIFIFFSDEKSVGVKTMRKLLNILEEKNIAKGIIIFPGTMTSSARKVISAMQARFKLEEFAEADLLVNITLHKLVPRHEILDAEQKKLLLERYRLKETQLPRIQLADPIARYYGLRRGQVVKITRPSETSGRYASYRICF